MILHSLNESIVEDAALSWFGELGLPSATVRTWPPANRRRSGIPSAGITKNLAQSAG